MFISTEIYNTCDFPGGPGPPLLRLYPPLMFKIGFVTELAMVDTKYIAQIKQ